MFISGSTELARMNAMQSRTNAIQNDLVRVGKELSSGLKTDLYEASGGNKAKLYAIERALDRNDAFSRNITVSEQRLTIAQNSLEVIQLAAEDLSVDMLAAAGSAPVAQLELHADEARIDFANAVSMLNSQANGATIFGGMAVSSVAMEKGETILAELDTLVAGAPDAATAIGLIETYFDAAGPGDYYTNAYLGSDQNMAEIELAEGDRLDFGIRGDTPEVVAMLQAYAISAVVAGGLFAGDSANIKAMMGESGEQMLSAKQGVLNLRAQVGTQQEQIEDAKSRNTAERTTLELTRLGHIGKDETESAAEFKALEAQLDAAFIVTARLASISFTNYM
ncbi:hypothetical protein [Amaricoccus tamworthensis]|uniref:hypothetical protein n=1 Tax=Amaricoccus tamworthensis TaxID=57002 RepID=UPI003C7A7A7E